MPRSLPELRTRRQGFNNFFSWQHITNNFAQKSLPEQVLRKNMNEMYLFFVHHGYTVEVCDATGVAAVTNGRKQKITSHK